jgi:FdhD protein
MELSESTMTATVAITRVTGELATPTEDWVAVEDPLEIRLLHGPAANQSCTTVSITMRTPGNDEELAMGFLFTEGIISSADDAREVKIDALNSNVVTVALKGHLSPSLQNASRNFYTTSSCGVCGKASIDAIKTVSRFQNIRDELRVDRKLLSTLPDVLRKNQQMFDRTGGLHASALFDRDGRLIMLREDVGRHNALDKVIGACLASHDLPLDNHILLLSGRASFELIQKASMAGIRMVAAIGSPSSLAVTLAKEFDITLAGFLRSDHFNIYSGSCRIL